MHNGLQKCIMSLCTNLNPKKNIVIFTYPRTGSTALQNYLATLYPSHTLISEYFNPWREAKFNHNKTRKIIQTRLNQLKRKRRPVIVKVFSDVAALDTKVLDYFIKRKDNIIILERENNLQSILSFEIARKTNIWTSVAGKLPQIPKKKLLMSKRTFLQHYKNVKWFNHFSKYITERANCIMLTYTDICNLPISKDTIQRKKHNRWFKNIRAIKRWYKEQE